MAAQSFAELLRSAVNEPGIISEAYSRFHNYSFGNVLLAWVQAKERGLHPGPLATFNKWREFGRWVKKGEKGITLCRPTTITIKDGNRMAPRRSARSRDLSTRIDGSSCVRQTAPLWPRRSLRPGRKIAPSRCSTSQRSRSTSSTAT